MNHQDDTTVNEFLALYDIPEAVETHERVPTNFDDGLLVASDQLLAETEELLASYQSPINKEEDANSSSSAANSYEENKQDSVSDGKTADEKRRANRNAQAAIRRLRYRQKLQNEKETLTQQASELSSQLTDLQTAQAEIRASQAGYFMLGAWKAMARRQLERRVEAEQQQKLLRAEVVDRARMMQQMHTLLQDRLQKSRSDPVISWGPMERNEDSGSSELHKTLIAELDGHYARTDEVFAGLQFKKAVPMTYSLTRKWKDGILYFDSADRLVFPRKFEQAADAISIVMMSDQDTDFESVRIQDVKDTMAMTFEVKYKLSPQKDTNIVIYGVGKRYQEKDRLVLLWRGFTEGRDEFDGCQSNETVWMVVRPSSDVSDVDCGNESTVVDCYSRLVPMNLDGTRTSGSDVKLSRFVKIIAESGEQDSRELTEMMKKLMVREDNVDKPPHSGQ